MPTSYRSFIKRCLKCLIVFLLIPHIFSSHQNQKSNSLSKKQNKYYSCKPYFLLPTLNVPVIREGEPAYTITILIELKVIEKLEHQNTKMYIPCLIDGIFMDLYKSFGLLWIPPQLPSSNILKERILAACQKILGKNIIENAYIHKLIIRSHSNGNNAIKPSLIDDKSL